MATKAFKRMQSSPQAVVAIDRRTRTLYFVTVLTIARLCGRAPPMIGSSSSSSTLLSVTEEQNASLIKLSIRARNPQNGGGESAMAANLPQKNREVFQ